jgi:two-component system OmpR family sensor kinase
LAAVALGVIETITYIKIRETLIANVDSQMQASVGTWKQFFFASELGRPLPSFENVQPFTYGAFYLSNGQLAGSPIHRCDPADNNPECKAQPVLPAKFVTDAARAPGQIEQTTVPGQNGVRSFRVLAEVIAGGPASPGPAVVLLVGFPLTGVDQTSGRVLGLGLAIAALLLACVAVASWFLVQLGLRPLEQMSQTASEIAAGDLTKRVEDTDTRTEVGQLGAALNVMLTQIERAFAEKQASEEQLRRFIADASHELRTPLTSIRGYAELFKSGYAERPEDLAAALSRIESESVRMGGLVEDLLLLARLDQGRPLSHETVDVTQLAADAVQDAGVVDHSREVRLVADHSYEIIGDERGLRQVLANLLSNAIKYSTPGSPIEVSVRPGQAVPVTGPNARIPAQVIQGGPDSGATARPLGPSDFATGPRPGPGSPGTGPQLPVGGIVAIAVVDHGPGIPPEIRPYVFERFWRADPSRKRTSGGNGLGLSIVAAVVAAHSGRVTIHSTPGGGTTFLVELPVTQPGPPPPPASLPALSEAPAGIYVPPAPPPLSSGNGAAPEQPDD